METRNKKRKTMHSRTEIMPNMCMQQKHRRAEQSFFLELTEDTWFHTFSFLEYMDLIAATIVCKSWKQLVTKHNLLLNLHLIYYMLCILFLLTQACTDLLWGVLCDKLWSDKVYVPMKIREHRLEGKSKSAFEESLRDAQRTYLTQQELLSFEWRFRFTSMAGEIWTQDDPWWQGLPARRMQWHTGFDLNSNKIIN